MEQVDEGKVLEEESDDEGYYMEDDEDEHTDPLLDTSLHKDKEKEKNNGAAVSSTTLGKGVHHILVLINPYWNLDHLTD